MRLNILDYSIILGYLVLVVLIGFFLSRKAGKSLNHYFLGGNQIKWYFLGLSNASGMFDISGVMWSVTLLFVYGLKSAWIPWLWPVWNQVFIMVFLALWIRRSNVMTGASWVLTRFSGKGGVYSKNIIILFAVISAIGFIAYFFEGIGKFCEAILPFDLTVQMGSFTIPSKNSYAFLIISLTTMYTLKGGIFSVVATEVFQYFIMTLSSIAIAVIVFFSVSNTAINEVVPQGWDQLFFGWEMNLDWSDTLPALNDKIATDGFEFIGVLFMMMLFKGFFSSLAGPVPGYDMQRILSTKSPFEAAKMSGFTILVLYAPRYLMIAAFAVLALVYLTPDLKQMTDIDFEILLPETISQLVPTGLKGLILAGLLAAFMGTFAAVVNAAPAYIANDLLKKNLIPNKDENTYVRYGYLAAVVIVGLGMLFGFFATSLNTITLWITASLYGGYTAANVLKWIWWRFNGHGYFWGMLAGLLASTLKLVFLSDWIDIYLFPAILAFSLLGCLLGSLCSPPDDMETLKSFYKSVKPWGFWKPILKEVQKQDTSFEPNQSFSRDFFNVIVGIIWQMTLVVWPVYLLIRKWEGLVISLVVFFICTLLLKKYWYDPLKKEHYEQN
ncbi:Na+:solute symporter [Flavobacteriaceae bacterium]|jgi:SSS family solute:Na+ symporter|nr:Na+:solute symporter [Flavobacteriaceae bacterium]MDC1012513.1 Na+:solute symporter [Flavobacteriaceae bacterium]MDC3329773.1 Na+:solute symporter [Flavobacteriaceae bacterium]